jgi:hypothetical protein
VFIVFGMFIRGRFFWLFCMACGATQIICLFRMVTMRWVG